MKIPTITFQEQLAYVRSVWRLILLMGMVQIAGGVFLILKQWCATEFGSFWYGGAFATPVGFILGLCWQQISRPGSIKQNWPIVLLLGAGAIFMPIAASSEMYSFMCTVNFKS